MTILQIFRKAQINLEYIVSLTLFVTLAVYIAFQLVQRTPAYLKALHSEYIRSEAYQLSELLINTPGEPSDWEIKSVERIKRFGLSGGKMNLLSMDKINRLDSICTNYEDVASRLGITEYQISIFIKDNTNEIILLDCLPSQVISRQDIVSIRRIVAFDSGNYGEFTIQVW